jgi:hypothetical protein
VSHPRACKVKFVILLAEHDEPAFAAKKERQPGASSWPTSTPKNRVWGFENTPSGRPSVEPQLTQENATGSVQYTYRNASGRAEWLSRDPLGEQINQPRLSLQLPGMRSQYKPSLNLYSYCLNDPVGNVDRMGLAVGDWWDPSTYASSGFWQGASNLDAWEQSSLATDDGILTLGGVLGSGPFAGDIEPGNQYNQCASTVLGGVGAASFLAAAGVSGVSSYLGDVLDAAEADSGAFDDIINSMDDDPLEPPGGPSWPPWLGPPGPF